MARYRKVETQTWSDRRFRALSAPAPNAQTLWMYLLTGPRTTIFPGLVVANEHVIASDLRWPLDLDLFSMASARAASLGGLGGMTTGGSAGGSAPRALRECFAELIDQDMIRADFSVGLIMLTRGLFGSDGEPRESSKPSSPNVLMGWLKSWNEIPDCRLKDQYLSDLHAFTKALGKKYVAVVDALAKRGGSAGGSATPSARGALPPALGERSGSAGGSAPGSGTGTGTGSTSEEDALSRSRARARAHDPTTPESEPVPQQGTLPLTPKAHLVALPHETDRSQRQPHLEALPSETGTSLRQPHLVAVSHEPSDPSDTSDSGAAGASLRPGLSERDPDVIARRALGERVWERLNRERAELAKQLGLPEPRHLHPQLPGRVALAMRLQESGASAEADVEHVMHLARAEVIATNGRALQYFSGSLFEPKSWARKLAMSVADIRPTEGGEVRGFGRAPARGEVDAFAAVDSATAAITQRTASWPTPTYVVDRAPSPELGLRLTPNWTGPREGEISASGILLARVPPERWPYGPPEAHQACCNLFPHPGNAGGLFCDCAASAAADGYAEDDPDRNHGATP